MDVITAVHDSDILSCYNDGGPEGCLGHVQRSTYDVFLRHWENVESNVRPHILKPHSWFVGARGFNDDNHSNLLSAMVDSSSVELKARVGWPEGFLGRH